MMPSIDDKNETEEDDMDAETGDSEKSEDDEESVSGTDEDSSELDEEECERRRNECVDDMLDLEKQFTDLKDHLYRERLAEVEAKLDELKSERAHEYLQPLEELEEEMNITIEVAGILRDLELINLENKYEAEEKAANENYESDKIIVLDTVRNELEEKLRRLEEDRHTIHISSDLWHESQASNKKKRKFDQHKKEKERKPITVAGPYIVYLLKDIEIIEDWTTIKKALKQSLQRRKAESISSREKHMYQAKYEEGRLYYDGAWYTRGHNIIIDNGEESPVHATVTAVNSGEVWVKRSDGNKSKLFISQLQKGKYTVRHVPY